MFKKSAVDLNSAFYPSLHFTLSLQSAFYTRSAFFSGSAVRSLRFTLTDSPHESEVTTCPLNVTMQV